MSAVARVVNIDRRLLPIYHTERLCVRRDGLDAILQRVALVPLRQLRLILMFVNFCRINHFLTF